LVPGPLIRSDHVIGWSAYAHDVFGASRTAWNLGLAEFRAVRTSAVLRSYGTSATVPALKMSAQV
jgi:hypothetical protein